MADCQCLPGCPFYNDHMKGMEGMKELYKTKYCRGDNSQCARFMVFQKLGKEAVPADLFPSMVDRAKEILATAS